MQYYPALDAIVADASKVDAEVCMQEDLEYFRRYAMPDPDCSRDPKPDGDDEPQPAMPAE